MKDLGDYVIVKDINGNMVTIPKTDDFTTLEQFERKAGMAGFDRPIECLRVIRKAMQSNKMTMLTECNPESVEMFLNSLSNT